MIFFKFAIRLNCFFVTEAEEKEIKLMLSSTDLLLEVRILNFRLYFQQTEDQQVRV